MRRLIPACGVGRARAQSVLSFSLRTSPGRSATSTLHWRDSGKRCAARCVSNRTTNGGCSGLTPGSRRCAHGTPENSTKHCRARAMACRCSGSRLRVEHARPHGLVGGNDRQAAKARRIAGYEDAMFAAKKTRQANEARARGRLQKLLQQRLAAQELRSHLLSRMERNSPMASLPDHDGIVAVTSH